MNNQDNQQQNLQNSLSQAKKRYFNIDGILTVTFSNQTQLHMKLTSGTVQGFELSFKESFFNIKNINEKTKVLSHISFHINYRDNIWTANSTTMEIQVNKIISFLESSTEINHQFYFQVAKMRQDLKEILYFLRN